MREDRVGCLWVVVFITLTFLGVCFLPQPAEAADGCPKLVARWCPPPHETPLEASHSPVERLKRLVGYYFPPWAVQDAVAVASCETGGTFDPQSWNPRSGASGWFQHIPRYWAERSTKAGYGGASIFDEEANVAVAAWLFGQTGTWQHWTCRP